MRCTPCPSTRPRIFVRPVAGLPSSSSTMNLMSRPASRYLFSSKKSSKPLSMSLPLAASGPLCGTSMPIWIGPFWASDGPAARAAAATTSTVSASSRGRMSVSFTRERADDFLIAERPAEGGLDQPQREAMHVLAVHGVHGVGGNDHAKVPVGRLEGGAEHAGGRVDPGQDDGVDAETLAQHELQVGRLE